MNNKISYIVVPKHEDRGATASGLSKRLIGNAMRLLVAIILMGALVVIIILAAHTVVNNKQPVQPWTLAPTPEPASPEPTPKSVIMERKYILCKSELADRRNPYAKVSLEISEDEHLAIQNALDVFNKKCCVIVLHIDINKKEHTNPSPPSSHWNTTHSCHVATGLPENQPTPLRSEWDGCKAFGFTGEQLFHDTPFLSMLQELLNSEEDMLDRCVRLLLAWRFGGVVWDLDALVDETHLRYFKEIMDSKKGKVLVEEDTAIMVYSRHSCHAAIGSMLRDFAQFPLNPQFEHLKHLVNHTQRLYDGSIYFPRVDDPPSDAGPDESELSLLE